MAEPHSRLFEELDKDGPLPLPHHVRDARIKRFWQRFLGLLEDIVFERRQSPYYIDRGGGGKAPSSERSQDDPKAMFVVIGALIAIGVTWLGAAAFGIVLLLLGYGVVVIIFRMAFGVNLPNPFH